MAPPTEPPGSPLEHARFLLPWTFSHIQPVKKLMGWAAMVFIVVGVLLSILPLKELGDKVGVPVCPAMPWWGYLAMGVLCAGAEIYFSNRQELVKRNGYSDPPPRPEE